MSYEAPLNTINEDGDEIEETTDVPEGEKKSENWLFFWLGDASLLAWNMVLNAIDIYAKLLPGRDMGVQLSRAYNIPCSITALILCFFKPSNYYVSLIISLSGIILSMIVGPILFCIDLSEDSLYWGTLITIGILSVFSSLTFSNTFSFATQYGETASASASSGNGCCGVIAGLVRIITKGAFNKESQTIQTSVSYFVIAIIIIALTLIYFILKSRNPAIKASLHAKSEKKEKMCSMELWHTFKVMWIQWASVAFNFFITLMLFPGYTSRAKESKAIGDWTYVIITFIFCIFDWVGRYLPAKVMWPPMKYAWIPIICRLLFFLIFMISIERIVNVGDPYWTIAWQIPFALSNGYFGTVNLVYGSNHDKLTTEGKAVAGLLISFAVNFGILLAMIFTFALPPVK